MQHVHANVSVNLTRIYFVEIVLILCPMLLLKLRVNIIWILQLIQIYCNHPLILFAFFSIVRIEITVIFPNWITAGTLVFLKNEVHQLRVCDIQVELLLQLLESNIELELNLIDLLFNGFDFLLPCLGL